MGLSECSSVSIKHEKFEIVTVFEGIFKTTGQAFQILSSYLPGEIKWGHRFIPILSQASATTGFEIDFTSSPGRFNKTVEVPTPRCSSKKLHSLSWFTEEFIGDESMEERNNGHVYPFWLQEQMDKTPF
ncbi:UNVERIFIED_CONTAM: hypothetical protein FKN15_041023 [Acipenser sinensis]